MSELFKESIGNNVEKDDDVVLTTDTEEMKAEVNQIQRMNQKAADTLLNSTLTDAEKGQSVFCLIEKFHNAQEGFAGGQFHKEWMAMAKRHEEVESKSITDTKEEYHSARMKEDQQPSLFIVQMERLKIKMKEKGYEIKPENFPEDILSKLPES